MEQYVLNTINSVIEKSSHILMPEAYLSSKKKRKDLANFYKNLLNIGSEYPDRPVDMKISTANTLYKDVCNSCPSKVRPSVMKQEINNAIRLINKYVGTLKNALEGVEVSSISTNVHDLRPNI